MPAEPRFHLAFAWVLKENAEAPPGRPLGLHGWRPARTSPLLALLGREACNSSITAFRAAGF